MDFTPFVGPVLTAVITGGGVYAAITNRLTRLETLIESLRTETEKHNSVIERTYRLETQQANIFHQLDELKAEIKGGRQ